VILKIFISQQDVATQLRCGGIFNNHFRPIANFLQSVTVNFFWNRSIFGEDHIFTANDVWIFIRQETPKTEKRDTVGKLLKNWLTTVTTYIAATIAIFTVPCYSMERYCHRMASVCLSVRPSVTLMIPDHIRWARRNFITRL